MTNTGARGGEDALATHAAVRAARHARECFLHSHVFGELGASPPQIQGERAEVNPWPGDHSLVLLSSELVATAALLKQSTEALTKEKTLSASLKGAVQRLHSEILQGHFEGGRCSRQHTTCSGESTHEDGERISDASDCAGLTDAAKTSARACASSQIVGSHQRPVKHEIASRDGAAPHIMNWTDASCQVGWAESTADKACQAHDTKAALVRLRWAARDFCHRRCEMSVIQRVIAGAKDDVLSSKKVLQEILNGRKQAEFQVVTAKRAREEHIEQSLRRKRQQEPGAVLPMLPVLIQDEHDHEPKDSAGCFGRARAKPDLQAHRRQKDELRSLMTNHAREWSELLTHTRNERIAIEDALMLLHEGSIRAAQSNLEMWLGLTSHCGELEALCSGDAARERLRNITLEKAVSELQMKVDSLQETVAQQQQEWAQQVEDFERRDRLCVQEDIEIRRRAHSAEKALMLTLERVRTLERAATRDKPIQRCLPSAEEVMRLRQELHKSKAAIAALSASLVFQQTRPSPDKIVRHAGKDIQSRTSGVLTPVAFDHSVLEDQLGQLQCAMDVFSPEWKMEAQMRALKRDSRVGGSAIDVVGQVLCLGDLEVHCDADGPAGRADGEEEANQVDSNNIRATLSVISSRNTGTGLLHLDEPNLSVAVDGCVTLSRSVAEEQPDVAPDDAVDRGQTARHYDFNVAPTSLIRLCICDWPSDSTKAVQGVVKIDVAQVLPVEWDRGATVVHKDWFLIRNAQGDAVRAHEGAALPAELELVLRLEAHVRQV